MILIKVKRSNEKNEISESRLLRRRKCFFGKKSLIYIVYYYGLNIMEFILYRTIAFVIINKEFETKF